MGRPKKDKGTVIEQTVHVPAMERRQLAFELHGQQLLVSRFDEKAIVQMLAKHMGKEVHRTQKDPKRDAESRKYLNIKNQDCIPVMTVKGAVVEAAPLAKNRNLSKKVVMAAFQIIGMTIPIDFDSCDVQMDVTKNDNGVPDIRFRPCYTNWRARIVVDFNSRLLTADQVVYLLA